MKVNENENEWLVTSRCQPLRTPQGDSPVALISPVARPNPPAFRRGGLQPLVMTAGPSEFHG
jgi:hypothetical protein